MRQALGLRSSGGGQPVAQRREGEQRGRRFVKDGEVPVVVVHSSSRDGGADGNMPTNRIAAAEQATRAERSAREQAERALAEAQTTVQHLRTQLAHAEMAHREALAGERRAREQAEQALQTATEARVAAEARVAELEAAPRHAEPEAEPVDEAAMVGPPVVRRGRPRRVPAEPTDAIESAAPRKRGRPPRIVAVVPADPEGESRDTAGESTGGTEPEPVKWWLPTYRASARKR